MLDSSFADYIYPAIENDFRLHNREANSKIVFNKSNTPILFCTVMMI